MRYFNFPILTLLIVISFGKSSSSFKHRIKAQHEIQNGKDVLYYGWFTNEKTSSSIQSYTEKILEKLYIEIPDVKNFLDSISWNVTENPLNFFVKPVDPSTGKYDPYYHITAKYCGGGIDCSEYYEKVKSSIEKEFQTYLIGFFFTANTFGIRVNLTTAQVELFDNEKDVAQSYKDELMENEVTQAEKEHWNKKSISKKKKYPGIIFESQSMNFNSNNSTAHSTLGCGNGIPAVQTGIDLGQIIKYEINETVYKDWIIPNLGVLRIYNPGSDVRKSAFVIYPKKRLRVIATFLQYPHHQNSTNKI